MKGTIKCGKHNCDMVVKYIGFNTKQKRIICPECEVEKLDKILSDVQRD